MKNFILTAIALLTLFEIKCVSNEAQCKIEKIQPPVNLSYNSSGTSGFTEINFWGENTEDGFDGYSMFIATTAALAKSKAIDIAGFAVNNEDYFCKIAGCTLVATQCYDYKEVMTIQIGGSSSVTNLTCETSTGIQLTSISSGQFIALRARAVRTTIPEVCGTVDKYSQASVIQIP